MRTPREFPIFTIFVLMVITLYAREGYLRSNLGGGGLIALVQIGPPGWSLERSFLPE
jgi:hypothetical protein